MDSCCSSHLRGSRKLTLLIVALALLLDNMLLTSVVPIIPSFLYHLNHGGTDTVPEQNLPIVPTISLSDGPYFLPLIPHSKESSEEWESFTVVPNNIFWPTHLTSEESITDLPVKNEIERRPTKHDELVAENFEVSLMFASKPFVQAIANPFVGPLSNKLGYSFMMFIGFLILITTSLAFAIGNSYATMFMARALQGVGSACTSVSGMGMLAEKYPDDAERGNAMAIALGGLALGVLIGPVFGGTLYEFVGKAAPFLILGSLAVIDGVLQLLVLQPKIEVKKDEDPEGDSSLLSLIKDPYIIIAAGAITFSNIGIAVLEPSLPLWMMDTMNASKWQQGVAFLPASISYLIGTNLFGPLGHKMGRWLAAMIGLITIGVCLMCVPLAKSVEDLIPANAGIGFAIVEFPPKYFTRTNMNASMVDSSMMPMLGYLVDLRHTSVYGCVYAIADLAFCLGFIIGPVFSATIVHRFGFEGSVCAVALTSFCYAPLLVFLRKPKGKKKPLSILNSTEFSLKIEDDDNEEDVLKKFKEQPNCY